MLSLIYLTIHFLWLSYDSFKEQIFRLSGIEIIKSDNKAPLYPSGGEYYPNAEENKDSTLYSWWRGRQRRIVEYDKKIKEIVELHGLENPNLAAQNDMIETIFKQEEFIHYSLLRFEKGFWSFQKSQIFRWMFLDILFPVFVGAFSVFSIANKFFL